MPRDGSQNYYLPAGTPGIPNYPIESSKYNVFIADVEQDLNLPRPITHGGTGATNATDAMLSLKGDVAYQVITNYDMDPFVSGSFSSASSATGSPVSGHAFMGICYTADPAVTPPALPAGSDMFIEARDVTTGIVWVRQKTAGVWGGAWAQQVGSLADTTTSMDARYVNVTGDTMTGALTTTGLTSSGDIMAGNGIIRFQNDATGKYLYHDGTSYTLAGGALGLSGNSLSCGPATVSGTLAVTGTSTFGGTVNVTGQIQATSSVTGNHLGSTGDVTAATWVQAGTHVYATGNVYVGTNTNTFIASDGSSLYLRSAGPEYFQRNDGYTRGYIDNNGLNITGVVNINGGTCYLNSAATAYINYGGGQLTMRTASGGAISIRDSDSQVTVGSGIQTRQGNGGSYGGHTFNFYWDGVNGACYVDGVQLAPTFLSSDYRIKKDVIDLPGMWDTVKGLHPIQYTHKAHDIVVNDDKPHWGFIAHELQEALLPTAASGSKDCEGLQGPNPMPIIAALTKALQEAMARIEALEAK